MSEENGTHDISYNLFNYGYKELTQDAFICWLIKWAYYNGTGYEKLKKCGLDFVNALFAKHGKNAPDNLDHEDVEIWMQNKSIDVLARIGDYVLLIEDKTGTGDHSNQLKRYYDIVSGGDSAAGTPDEENIIPIFLKTGNQPLYDKLSIEGATEHKYKVFERKNFLDVIKKPCYQAHPIISDFYNHLMHKEEATNRYKKWRESGNENEEDSYRSCEGFFRELENKLCVLDSDSGLVGFDNKDSASPAKSTRRPNCRPSWGWDYVPNRAGGFTGFWWYYKTVKSCGCDVEIYLQLEIQLKLDDENKPTERNTKLCFKVRTQGNLSSSDRRNIREDCYTRIEAEKNKLFRPHMGNGNTMTFAQWDDEKGQNPWLVFNKASVGPDIQETVNNLIRAQNILDRVASHGNSRDR